MHVVDKDPKLIFDPLLKKHNLEYPTERADKLYNTVIFPVVMNLKWQYNRPRPYQLAPKFGSQINYIKTDSINLITEPIENE